MVYNWLIDPLTNGLLEVCGELGILVLAYCKDSTPISQELTWSLTQKSSTPRTRFPRRQDQACRGSSREWHACQDPPTLARRQLPQECPASWWYRSPCKEEGMHSEPDRHQLALITLSSPGDVYDRAHPWLYQARPYPRERDNHRSYRRGLARYRQATCIFYACRWQISSSTHEIRQCLGTSIAE